MSPFRLAVLNLSRRKVPTLVALTAIALSVGFSGVLLRLYRLSNSRFSSLARGGDAVVGAKAGGLEILLGSLNLEGRYPDFIPYNLYETLKNRRGVQFEDGEKAVPTFVRQVIPLVYFAKYGEYRVIATDETFIHRPENASEVSPSLAEGRWADGNSEVVLGSAVARHFQLSVGNPLTARAWLGEPKPGDPEPDPVPLVVTGILAPTESAWDSGLYSNLEMARSTFERAGLGTRSVWGVKVLHYFLIYLQGDGMLRLESLINKRSVAEVVGVEHEKTRLAELTGTGRRLGLLMSLLILGLGSLSVAAMMITRFDAMTVQLAVLRALGYAKREIRRWLVWEGVLLGFAAIALGAILDLVLFPVIRGLLGSALPPASLVHSPLWESWPVWCLAMTATVLAVFVPLIRLYHQDVHVALKG